MSANQMADRYNEPFPARLRELMKSGRVTQQALAEVTHVKRQTISTYSDGSTEPPLSKLVAMSDFFGVSLDYLVGREACKTPDNEAIHKRLGLSDRAINALDRINDSFSDFGEIEAINCLLGKRTGLELLRMIGAYLFADFGECYKADSDVYEGYEGMERIPIRKIDFVWKYGPYQNSEMRFTFDTEELAGTVLLRIPEMLNKIRKSVQSLRRDPNVDQETPK